MDTLEFILRIAFVAVAVRWIFSDSDEQVARNQLEARIELAKAWNEVGAPEQSWEVLEMASDGHMANPNTKGRES